MPEVEVRRGKNQNLMDFQRDLDNKGQSQGISMPWMERAHRHPVWVQVGSAARSRALSAAANAQAKRQCQGQQGPLWLGRSFQADVPSGLVGGLGRVLTSVSAAGLISHLILSCQRGRAGAGATAGAH